MELPFIRNWQNFYVIMGTAAATHQTRVDGFREARQGCHCHEGAWKMREASKGSDLSRKAILSEIDNSLKRLDTDYLELYLIHRASARSYNS